MSLHQALTWGEIGHRLALINLWNGRPFGSYSVAARCVLITHRVAQKGSKIFALLYGADKIHDVELSALYKSLDLAPPTAEIARQVESAEQTIIATEHRDIMRYPEPGFVPTRQPLPDKITLSSPREARGAWLAQLNLLTGKHQTDEI